MGAARSGGVYSQAVTRDPGGEILSTLRITATREVDMTRTTPSPMVVHLADPGTTVSR